MATPTTDPTAGERIRNAQAGEFVTIQKIVPTGSLQARKLKNGTTAFYWRYGLGGKTDRVMFGNYDPRLPPKQVEPRGTAYSIAGAAKRAAELAQQHLASIKAGDGGHRATEQAQAQRKAAEKAATVEAAAHTLKSLVIDYCDHLEALGRSSHRDARSIFTLHVIDAFPTLAALPAVTVTEEQVADMLRRLYEAGKGRTANKLRAYLALRMRWHARRELTPACPLPSRATASASTPLLPRRPSPLRTAPTRTR
jgi:hypothetical protein